MFGNACTSKWTNKKGGSGTGWNLSGVFQERLQRFVPRLVQLLAEWTETFPYDFRDERVMGHVRSITQKVAAVDAAARQEVSALLQNLLLRLTALERYEEGLARLATEATTEQLSQVRINALNMRISTVQANRCPLLNDRFNVRFWETLWFIM